MIKRRNINLRRERQAAAAMMTVEDLAATLGIGRNQAYGMVKREQVKAMRIGRRWLIPRAEVDRLIGVDAETGSSELPAEQNTQILQEVRNMLRVNSAMVQRCSNAITDQAKLLDAIHQWMIGINERIRKLEGPSEQ